MTGQIEVLLAEVRALLADATTTAQLKALDTELLGKHSTITALRAGLRDVAPEDRPAVGKLLGAARAEIESALAARRSVLAAAERSALLEHERLDLSEVIPQVRPGSLHPIRLVSEWLEDTFVGMGYTVEEGPEVETDWYNFGALNLPEHHPARSMWDTLYLDVGEPGSVLLRTHTSPVQIRTMLTQEPPIRMVAPGKTFRRDTADATHLPMFHQLEALVIDRNITMGDLAGTIELFVQALFGADRHTRLRPSYFPFTEPSAEFDISLPGGGWLELGGCGMVHPNVLVAGGLDPEEWQGFAFGFGIDRLAKERFGMADIRDLVASDVRFLRQIR
jgi:phenylalanyl-tRNA synthetase alpha chain